MAVDLGPKLGQLINADIGEQYYDQFRPFLRAFDSLVLPNVISMALTSPPGSPTNGNAYILVGSPSGAWTGHQQSLAVWSTEITQSGNNTKVPGWDFYAPKAGWTIYDNNTSAFYYFNGTAWVALISGGGGVGGSGTLGFIPLWTPDGATLGDSPIDYGITTDEVVTINAAGTVINVVGNDFGAIELNAITGTNQGEVLIQADGEDAIVMNATTGAIEMNANSGSIQANATSIALNAPVSVHGFSNTKSFQQSAATWHASDSPVNGSLATVNFCDATSGDVIVNLPSATGNAGFTVYMQKIDGLSGLGHDVTAQPFGSDTIQGGSSYTLTVALTFAILVSRGNGIWSLFST